MKRFLAIAAALAAAASLSACANGAGMLEQIDKTYAHCERNITYSAGFGILTPGVQIAGSVKCDPKAAPSAAEIAPLP